MIDKNTIHQEMVKEFDEEQNLSGEGIEYQGQLYWPNGAQRSVGGDFMVGPMSPKSIDYQQLPNRHRELRLRSYTQKFNNLRSWMKAKLEQIHRATLGPEEYQKEMAYVLERRARLKVLQQEVHAARQAIEDAKPKVDKTPPTQGWTDHENRKVQQVHDLKLELEHGLRI